MPRFKEIAEDTGVTVPDSFMAVGLKASNLVSLEDAKGFNWHADPNALDVSRVTSENVGHFSRLLKDQFASLNVPDDKAKSYLRAMLDAVNAGPNSRLLFVTGKKVGRTGITVIPNRPPVSLGVWVLSHKQFTVAFRFVQMYDDKKNSSATRWMPANAAALVGELNWAYGLQANISFKLGDVDFTKITVSADDLDVTARLTGPNFLKYVAGDKSKTADLTIFFVPKYVSVSKRGLSETFPEKGICVVEDAAATELPVMKGSDAFVVNLVHEVAHFLHFKQDSTPLEIHHDRQGILLSSKLQSTRLDSGVVGLINCPDKRC
jgi:hypothetical protein